MTGSDDRLPTVSERLDMLFRVWLTPQRSERTYDDVAQELRQLGIEVNGENVRGWRVGETTPQASELAAVAEVFPGDNNADYFASGDRASAIHSQLALVLELVEGRVRDVRLRNEHQDIDRRELTRLLTHLRENTSRSSN